MSDVDRIRAEVERGKQQAWQLGLPELTTRFYRDLARFYPAWKENHPEIVPQLITEIREVGKDGVEFGYQNHRYSLTWAEQSTTLPDGDVYFSSTLTLLVDGSRVLEVYLHGDFSEYTGTEWRPSDVKAFIEGPWIAPFKALAAEGERLHALYLQRAEEERRGRETEDLRSRFGIVAEDPKNRPAQGQRTKTVIELTDISEGSLAARLGTLLRRLLGGGQR